MSTNAFRVKNSLHLTPQAVEPSGLEVGDLWMDIDGNLKRWDGSASQDVGSGGVGSVDIMFAQTLEQAVIGDFTTTGTVAITEAPLEILQGKKTLKITHTGGASAEQIVEVPAKFRNKNVTLSLDVASDAASGNLSLTVTDETNTVTLINAESIQPQEAGQTSVKRSVSFNVPSDCEELKYKFTAVSESGKFSFIDNVVIELTQMSKLDTTIETPIITEWQSYVPSFQGFGTPTNIEFQWRRNGESVEVRGKFTSGTSTAIEARIGLPNNYTSADILAIPSIQVAGPNGKFSAAGDVDVAALIEPSVTYFTFGRQSSGTVGLAKLVGSSMVGTGNTFSFVASTPIQGWEATETQSVSLAQTVLVQESDSAIQLDNANGYGSTGTKIARFSNQRMSIGDGIIYQDSAVNGASFTVTKDGIYTINFNAAYTANLGAWHGISKNASSLATNLASLPMSEVLTLNLINDADVASNQTTASWSGYLSVGDVIRPHTHGQTQVLNAQWTFSMSYQGSLKQLNVSENQKIEIPTSELRMEGASTRGTGSDSAIVRFDNIAKLRGDAFTVESTAALGTVITMKKKGKLDVSLNFHSGNNVGDVAITLNQATRTTATALASEIIATSLHNGTYTPTLNMSGEVHVNIGDIIRVAANGLPTANAKNSLNISFQEQEVSVSVTNVLPQFSESDSSVRVDTANGYGSTATKIRRFSNVRENLGSSITYADSAINGSSFTINEDGIYNVSYSDSATAADYSGISKNASSLITNLNSLATSEILALERQDTTGGAFNIAWSGSLQAGDIIRAHSSGTGGGNNALVTFTISKVGKPNVTGVDVTPFAKIEYEVSDYLYLTRSSWGTNGAYTVLTGGTLNRFTNRGVISYDPTNGRLTALKPCKLFVDLSGIASGANGIWVYISDETGNYSHGDYSGSISGGESSISKVLELQSGQFINVRIYNTGSVNLRVLATELRDAYQVIGGGVENTYSASIASGATLISQSYPFIASVTSGGTGLYNITYVSGFFGGVIPKVAPTAESSVLPNVPITAAVLQGTSTANGVTIRVSQGGTAINFPFVLDVQRQGSDYRTPSKAVGLPAQRIAYIKDVKAAGTAGGAFNSGAWQTRTLNDLIDPTGLVASLASNQFTLPAGVYDIEASAPAYNIARHKAKLRNITDSSDLLIGGSDYNSAAAPVQTSSLITGRINITSQKTFEIQHRSTATKTIDGFGVETNVAVDEVYTQVKITKIEE